MARVAPVVVGSPTYAQLASSASSFTIAVPPDLMAGDVLVVAYRTSGSTSTVDFSNAAFTRRGRAFTASDATRRVSGIQTHTVADPSAEPASYTFTKATADSRTVAAMFVVRGADTAALISGFSDGTTTSGGTSSADAFTVSSDPALLVGLWVAEITSPNSNVPTATPAAMTQVAQKGSAEGTSGTRSSLWVGAGPISGVTTTGPHALTWGTGYTATTAYVIAIRGAEASSTPPQFIRTSGEAVILGGSGSASLGPIERTSEGVVTLGGEGIRAAGPIVRSASGTITLGGSGSAFVSPVRTSALAVTLGGSAQGRIGWPAGFPNVAALLAKPGATIAHRGGSINFPEFSQYAYDQACLRGFGALEFSCGWTSDNVPFGLGDQYLDRTAGVTGNVDPKTMTWATLQANYANVLNPVAGQPSQPFMRLVDFLDRYTPDHVVAIDPKFGILNTALIDVMLDICDAHGGPSKIIVKFDSPGSGATSVATRARARGYKTMNYYGSNTTALASEQGNWDLLGVLYSASQSVFDTFLSYGKPLWGAVIPDQAGYNAAMAKGARIGMVRDVVNITPVSADTPLPLFEGYDTYLLGAGDTLTLLERGD